MPTSSQSQILSVVDQQLLQQQQSTGQDLTKLSLPTGGIEARRRRSKDERRPSTEKKSPSPSNLNTRRRSSLKNNDGQTTSRTSQRNDVLHMSVVDMNTKTNVPSKRLSDPRRSSLNNDNQFETDYKLKLNPTPVNDHYSSLSDLEDDAENPNEDRRGSLLNDTARRLLVLGTIRPSKSFYKDLPASDIEHLMEYFQRMRNANRRMSSEEINQQLKMNSTEYKPKMFYDSTCVTKGQVNQVEKLIEPYVEQLRTNQAELIKLDNPFRFVIKPVHGDTPLTTIPREYNDCLLTLVTRTDPLRTSDLIAELTSEKLSEDIKANSLDISYFPGGVNYDVPHDEIDNKGQMRIETYQKLKQRLSHRKVWHFDQQPEKKPHGVIAILPPNFSNNLDHQRLLNYLYERLKTSPSNENINLEEKILSIEYRPLSCILDSQDVSNEFIIDCDTNETKQQLMDKPLKINLNKQTITIEMRSYDEHMHKEYQTFLKAEKYRELIKNHDQAIKRTTTTK